MGLMLAFGALQQLSHLKTDVADKLRSLARSVASAGNAALAFRDVSAAREALNDSLGDHSEIVAAAIYDRRGAPFVGYGAAAQLPRGLGELREVWPDIRAFDAVADHISLIRVGGDRLA